jgi:D-glycero-D-manno-heptose 1,7-bisphosphate phosphatase
VEIIKTCVCPHINGCECKKPKTRFINELCSEYDIDVKKSWVFGDHPSDILLGINTRCNTSYLLTGHGKKHLKELTELNIKPDIISENFKDVVERMINM